MPEVKRLDSFGCMVFMGGEKGAQAEEYNAKRLAYGVDLIRRDSFAMPKLRCRQKPMIRAERLEGLVWGEVKRVLENPDLIVAGIEALDNREDGGLEEQIATTERDLQKVQMEEERVIRLFVSGKITEDQMDHQRRYITERLETLRARLDDYRDRETLDVEKRGIMENLVKWAGEFGEGLDNLPDQKRRELLQLLLDGVTIDRENNVNLTLAIPTEEFVSIETPISDSLSRIRPRSR